MQRGVLRSRTLLVALLTGAAMLLWSAASFAATPGADCGFGATIVGDDQAGKVTLGQEATNTCTLTFLAASPNGTTCTASNETNGGGYSIPVGTKATKTAVVLGGRLPWVDGDVISYICVPY